MLNLKNNIYSSKKIEITAKVKLFVVDQKKNKIHNHSTHFFKIMFFLISLWQTYKHIPNNKLCAISFLMARLTYLITPIAARRNKDKYILLNDFQFPKGTVASSGCHSEIFLDLDKYCSSQIIYIIKYSL